MIQRIKNNLNKPMLAGITAVVCCALWGSAFPAIKTGCEMFSIRAGDYGSQILFAGVRFTLAGLLTILLAGIADRKSIKLYDSRSIGKVAVLSLFQTVLQYLFFYMGLAKTTGTKGSILTSCSVFFSVLIVSVILKTEKLSAKRLIGSVIGFAGVVLINLSGGDIGSSFHFTGEGFMILSALSYSVSSVLIKRFSRTDNPAALSGWQFALGGAVMIFAGLALGGRLRADSIQAAGILLYLALLSAIAYTLWGILLKYNDVSKIAVYSFMTPVFGCLFSALFLNESLAGNAVKTVASLALVCTGILLVNSKEKKYEG